MAYIYLASPYSDPNAGIREYRYREACKAAAALIERGYSVFSPIAHSHPIAGYMDMKARLDHDLWLRVDLPLLRFAWCLCVLKLDGWENSRGIAQESDHANDIGIPIIYLDHSLLHDPAEFLQLDRMVDQAARRNPAKPKDDVDG